MLHHHSTPKNILLRMESISTVCLYFFAVDCELHAQLNDECRQQDVGGICRVFQLIPRIVI
jgi:hypothetical protein